MGIKKSSGAFAAFLALVVPFGAGARPVSYPGGWMVMSMNDHMQYSNMLSYSPTARDAFGVRVDYMREDEDWIHTATYNRLLKRWNAPHSQGNMFLMTGLGVAEHRGEVEPAATVGLAADWETRSLYFSYENRYIYGGDVERSFAHKARAGFAPYVGDYDDLHTWLMVQVDHHPSERDNFVVTPLVRLFTQEVLGELGVSHQGDVMVNITFQF
jgi:hypothetical protein